MEQRSQARGSADRSSAQIGWLPAGSCSLVGFGLKEATLAIGLVQRSRLVADRLPQRVEMVRIRTSWGDLRYWTLHLRPSARPLKRVMRVSMIG